MTEAMTTITPKFQLHIPVNIRKAMGMKRHGRAKIMVAGGRIVIEPVKDGMVGLAGAFNVKKTINAGDIRKHIDYSRF